MTPHKHRLLFLYMVPETGHHQAAEAIMKAVQHMDPQMDCEGLDLASHAYPIFGKVFNRMYLQMIKRTPFIWDYLYDNPDIEALTRDARGLLTMMSSSRVQKVLKRCQPSAIICTQAAPATALAAEKRKGRCKIPLIGVVTDFWTHTYWRHAEVDLYLVAHEDIKKNMVANGISANRICVTGIPIDPKFGESMDREEARRHLKIQPKKKTILMMGGSRGLGSMEKWVEALKKVSYRFQTLIVCGRNRRLLKKMAKITKGLPDFHVMGYTKNLSTLMSAADFLISKPGGLTCSEALAKQIPLILTNPLPGQEERNVDFLDKHGVAQLARTPDEFIRIVKKLLAHPKSNLKMKQKIQDLSKPHSAWHSARLILDLVGTGEIVHNGYAN